MLAAYLIEPGRAEYLLDDLAAEYGVEVIPDPVVDEETTALVKAAETPRRLAPLMVARLRERDVERLYRNVELPLTQRARRDGGRGREDRHVPHGRDHRAARRPRRGARVARVRARRRGVHDRLDAAGRARSSSRSSTLTPGRKGKTGYSTDTRVLRSIRHEHEIVEVIEEWREYSKLLNTYLGPLPSLLGAGRPAAHDDQPGRRVDRAALDDEPEPPGDPDPHRPRPRDPQRVHRRAGPPADERRLLADRAAHPRARQRRAEAARGVRARRRHPHRDGRRGARRRAGQADVGAAQRREDDQLRDRLRHLRVRPLREPRDPARGGAGVHRRVPRALPARAGLHRADEGAGDARRLRHVAARPPPAGAGDPRVEPRRRARSASGSPSTS